MQYFEELKARRLRRKEIDDQLARIEELARHVPEQTVDMQLWGDTPEELKILEKAEQWLEVLRTEDLRRRAFNLGVPMPQADDPELGQRMNWNDHQDEPYFLTSKGLRVLTLALREEEKYRWDRINSRITATTAPLGLLVAALALWLKK
jgi:hypothetical protein